MRLFRAGNPSVLRSVSILHRFLCTSLLLLTALARPSDTHADEPALARLTFWLPPEHIVDFEPAYEERLRPLLLSHRLVPSAAAGRATVDSAFSRLFEAPDVATIAGIELDLRQDSTWATALLGVVEGLGTTAGHPDTLATVDYWLRPYSGPMGEGRTVLAGSGTRRGSWLTLDAHDGVDGIVRDVAVTAQGVLWAATPTALSAYDGDTFTHFEPIPGGGYTGVIPVGPGQLWAGRNDGILRIRESSFEALGREDGWPASYVGFGVHPMVDRHGRLWLGGVGRVTRFEDEDPITRGVTVRVPVGEVRALFEDRQGRIWIGGEDGLYRLDGSTLLSLATKDSLAAMAVEAISQDAQGRIWCGGAGYFGGKAGLIRLDEEGFHDVTDALRVNSLAADPQGGIWVATSYGLAHLIGGRMEHYTAEDGLASNQVTDVEVDDLGLVWYGTWGGGLGRFDGSRITRFGTAQGLASTYAFGVAEDGVGDIWVAGGYGGVSRHDGDGGDDGFGRKWETWRSSSRHVSPITGIWRRL